MAEFPIEYSTATPSGRGPSVRAGTDVSTGAGAIGAAVAGLGGAIADLGIKYDLKEANTQFSKYKSDVRNNNVRRDAEVLNAKDSDEIVAIYEKYASLNEGLKPKNNRAIQAANLWGNQQIPINTASMFNARRRKTIDNERTRLFEKEQEVYADPSKLAEFEKELIRSQVIDKNNPDDIGPTFTKLEAARILARTRNMAAMAIKDIAIESIKPDLIAAIARRNNKEDGYEVLNAAMAQLAKDGILTEPEAAEANKKLGDWIDNYVAGRIKAAKDADELTTIQTYQELSKPILDGKLSYDDIDQSALLKADKERWHEYIKGSYKDEPKGNAPEGHIVSFNAVYDVATLQSSPKEGYDVLLEARFNDRSITNEQFEWAVDKIENPYPKHILEDLNATLKSNLEDFNRLFRFDDERNQKVNEALISWADDLIKQDKAPSKKEMFAMSSAFRAGGGQPFDIGRVIERGGIQWEIVGFDEDGEPLVEEIGGYGLRNDGITQKGTGFLGELQLRGGGVATEYSVGVKLEANDGKETDIPTLVPTLTKEEVALMVNDIIPNQKPVPKAILQKAVDYANKRVRQGKSIFFVGGK